MKISEEDFDRLRELNNEMQEIMTKYMMNDHEAIRAGIYGPIGSAKWGVGNNVQRFLRAVGA